jgi:hypothetical protein
VQVQRQITAEISEEIELERFLYLDKITDLKTQIKNFQNVVAKSETEISNIEHKLTASSTYNKTIKQIVENEKKIIANAKEQLVDAETKIKEITSQNTVSNAKIQTILKSVEQGGQVIAESSQTITQIKELVENIYFYDSTIILPSDSIFSSVDQMFNTFLHVVDLQRYFADFLKFLSSFPQGISEEFMKIFNTKIENLFAKFDALYPFRSKPSSNILYKHGVISGGMYDHLLPQLKRRLGNLNKLNSKAVSYEGVKSILTLLNMMQDFVNYSLKSPYFEPILSSLSEHKEEKN